MVNSYSSETCDILPVCQSLEDLCFGIEAKEKGLIMPVV